MSLQKGLAFTVSVNVLVFVVTAVTVSCTVDALASLHEHAAPLEEAADGVGVCARFAFVPGVEDAVGHPGVSVLLRRQKSRP